MLVTGATGFVGKRLFRALAASGCPAVGLSRSGGSVDGTDVSSVDISDIRALSSFMKGRRFSTVYHLAAYVPLPNSEDEFERCVAVNAVGTRNMLAASLKCGARRFVYASSYSVCNGISATKVDENASAPGNEYGITKLMGEHLCNHYASQSMGTVSLRYSSVYGEGQEPNSVLPRFVERIAAGKEIEIWGDGQSSFDFIYVDDAVRATVLAGSADCGGTLNIGTGRETSLNRLVGELKRIYPQAKVRRCPTKGGAAMRFSFDVKLAEKHLGFKAEYGLKAGLRKYADETEMRT